MYVCALVCACIFSARNDCQNRMEPNGENNIYKALNMRSKYVTGQSQEIVNFDSHEQQNK